MKKKYFLVEFQLSSGFKKQDIIETSLYKLDISVVNDLVKKIKKEQFILVDNVIINGLCIELIRVIDLYDSKDEALQNFIN